MCRKNKYIVTVTYYFSKWPEGAPLKDKTAVGVADFLFTVFCHHGWPDIIISDQGICKSTFKVIFNSFMHLNHYCLLSFSAVCLS